jgi:hypothetical protein
LVARQMSISALKLRRFVGMSRAFDLVLFVSRLRRRLLYYRAKS